MEKKTVVETVERDEECPTCGTLSRAIITHTTTTYSDKPGRVEGGATATYTPIANTK